MFLSMLIVGCLCLTAILHAGVLPQMWAEGRVEGSQKPEASSQNEIAGGQVTVNDGLVPAVPAIAVLPAAEAPAITITPKVTKAAPAADIKIYKGEKYRYVKTLRLRVTAYAPDGRCCWPYPGTTTSTGLSVKTNHGHLVAADPRVIPMHSLVAVPGYDGGAAVPVLDQGGAIKGHRLDVMLPSFDAAKEWGSRLVDVKVYAPVSN